MGVGEGYALSFSSPLTPIWLITMDSEYDKKLDALYIWFGKPMTKQVTHDVSIDDKIILEFDDKNRVAGLTICNPAKNLRGFKVP